jgi:hypothetical protein
MPTSTQGQESRELLPGLLTSLNQLSLEQPWMLPNRIEFWKGRSNRMHDRIEFSRTIADSGVVSDWQVQRLQP